MGECNHDCSSCSQNCGERKSPQDFQEKPNELSKIKKVIGVVSGKGGVGKSMVTSLLAVSAQRAGYKTAILDADVTGPSIPKAFGVKGMVQANELGIIPATTKNDISMISVNLLFSSRIKRSSRSLRCRSRFSRASFAFALETVLTRSFPRISI